MMNLMSFLVIYKIASISLIPRKPKKPQCIHQTFQIEHLFHHGEIRRFYPSFTHSKLHVTKKLQMQSNTVFQGILKKRHQTVIFNKYPFNTFVGGKHRCIPIKSLLHIKIKIDTKKLLIVVLALLSILKQSKLLK